MTKSWTSVVLKALQKLVTFPDMFRFFLSECYSYFARLISRKCYNFHCTQHLEAAVVYSNIFYLHQADATLRCLYK